MSDLVQRATQYATQVHTQVGQLRKYTQQPYQVHLKAVALMVAEVTDDEEMIAAAWLHDTVEDTEATFQDIELEFGTEVTDLVSQLTDVSKTADGNRAVRKAIDRAHLAQASNRAMTIKLADLIDNCRDITRNDEEFARVFVTEMAALLEVLDGGDVTLYKRAHKTLRASLEKLDMPLPVIMPELNSDLVEPDDPVLPNSQVQRLFIRAFAAREISEPLRSFDGDRPALEILARMAELNLAVIGVRIDGQVRGYARIIDLGEGDLADSMRPFRAGQVMDGEGALATAIQVLVRHDQIFVTVMGIVAGVITRSDIQKPIVRMWVFGVITMMEMNLAQRLRRFFPDESWTSHLSESRLDQARTIQAERERRGQMSDLVDCLQFSDKGEILIGGAMKIEEYGFNSKNHAKRVMKDLESLRNNLAHAQDIITHDWPQIVMLANILASRVMNHPA